MKRILLFLILSFNLFSVEIVDEIGIFNKNNIKDFEKKVVSLEKSSGYNFIFYYGFSEKIINLKGKEKTILLEMVKKEEENIGLNIYYSKDLKFKNEKVDAIIEENRNLMENGKYIQFSYDTAEKISGLGKTIFNKNFYLFVITAFIILIFIVKYKHKGFRVNRL